MKRAMVCGFFLLMIPLTVCTVEKKIQLPPDHPFGKLKPGSGVEVTEKKCGLCHSSDYIVTQPPGDLKRWQGEVSKMIKVYGASITEQEAEAIARYLASAYGPMDQKASESK